MTDTRTFEAIFKVEYAGMVALGSWLTGDRASAEDLTQEAFARAHRDWAKVGALDAPGAWVRHVLVNLASNERRRRRREVRAVARLEPPPPAFPEVPPDQHLWAAIADLPFNQRAAIALRYLHDQSADQIAEAIGCRPATARVHLHRAHRTLADRLGVALADDEAGPGDPAGDDLRGTGTRDTNTRPTATEERP